MLFSYFLVHLARKLKNISFRMLLALAVLHAAPAFFVYRYLGESELAASPITFAYYYVVTASSIGYGDLSPASDAGRLFTIIYLVPLAFALFATLIAKMVSIMVQEINNIHNGLGDYTSWKNHLVIVGSVPEKTDRLILELEREFKQVIVVTASDNRPLNPDVTVVRAPTLASLPDLQRAGIAGAKAVVVMAENDQDTLLAALAVTSLVDKERHVVAHFERAEVAAILEANCPNVETVANNAVDQVSRALADPGSSHVIANLVSTADPTALRSLLWTGAPIPVAELMLTLLENEATLVGYGSRADAVLRLRPADKIGCGQRVYYIAAQDIALDGMAAK